MRPFAIAGRAPATVAVVVLAIAASVIPAPPLVADAALVARGQLWRLLTGPLVHVTAGHLAWDLTILLLLGAFFEPRMAGRVRLTILLGLIVPTAAVFLADSGIARYYGTSGLTHALMAAGLAFELPRHRGRPWVWALACGFLAKLAWGVFGTGPLVGPSLAPGVRETPAAHVAGAAVGLGVVLAGWLRGSASGGKRVSFCDGG